MADVSLGDLGSSSNPLPGLDASDYEGFGSGGNISGSIGDPGSSSLFSGAGALGIGALGLGAILGQGGASLPSQFGQMQQQVPWLQSTGQGFVGQGQGLVTQGQQALQMAQAGQLTAPQQAQLDQYKTSLNNQARQTFYNMGRNPDNDTSFINQTANNDAQVNAMAQQQIQTTIQLGLGEISGGNSLISQGAGFENAANQILLQAGQAQLQADKNYSDSLTSVFSGLAKMAGAAFSL